MQGRNGDTDEENGLVAIVGKGEGGMNGKGALPEITWGTAAKAPAELWTPAGLDPHSGIAEQPRRLRAFGC